MCGIVGIVSDDLDARRRLLPAMLEAIAHRGPSQKGWHHDAHFSLGMARLAIVDADRHDIPYWNEDESSCLVYNGEVYNHGQVRANLAPGHRFKNNSDTETLVHALEEKGPKAITELNGMFALAFYDLRAGRLLLARDRAGEKNLYYTRDESGALLFASEIKALLAAVKPRLNEQCLSYRVFEFDSGRDTLFAGIHSMLPGEYIVVEQGRLAASRYWALGDDLLDLPDHEPTLVNRLAELLEDAIVLRTRNCVDNFACFISGGIDSALIACIAKPEHLFTVHYDLGPDFDELRYAEMVADRLKKPLTRVEPTPDDFHATRARIAWALDTPCTWTSFSLYCLVREAAKHVKIILSGEGADEIFAGYYRYLLLHHDQQIYQLEAMKQYDYLIKKYYGEPESRYARLINRAEDRAGPEAAEWLLALVREHFARHPGVLSGMGATDFYTTMQVLLQMSDRICMQFAVENRSPFLDHRVLAFAMSLPDHYKINNGVTKYLLRQVARKFIPLPIVERVDKRGFSAPLNRWFQWDQKGKYDRSSYRDIAYGDWRAVFFGDDSIRPVAGHHSRSASSSTGAGAALSTPASPTPPSS
ncbi:MAG: asparagine synthase (glutamine-hydrolyzing) [Planctomycetes bacterium]|nr:asparagine synthase (glutamine-hydrolyzing) [Planctomycetota bacterium]